MVRIRILLLILCAAVVYANTLGNDFIAGDVEFIMRNPAIADAQTVRTAFTSDYWSIMGGQTFLYYRPLIVASHVADYRFYGLNPVGHHLTNLVLHCVATLLVYGLLCTLLPGGALAAFAGGALFALHPIHTHSVSYVLGRTDVLAAIFYLAALLLLLRDRQSNWKLCAAGGCYFAALLCKEIAVTLPAVYLLLAVFWKDGARRTVGSALWKPLLVLTAALGVYLALRYNAVGGASPGVMFYDWHTLESRIPVVFITLGFYLGKLLLPVNLCYFSTYQAPCTLSQMLLSPYFTAGVLFCVVTVLLLKKAPAFGCAAALIVLTLLPVMNLFPMPYFAKENFLYLPSVGLSLLAALLIGREGMRRQVPALILMGVIAVLWAYQTVDRNRDYRDQATFLGSTLACLPVIPDGRLHDSCYYETANNYCTVYKNLGKWYKDHKAWEQAAQAFEQALHYGAAFPLRPMEPVMVALGSVYAEGGHYDKAVNMLQEALTVTPRPHHVYNMLGVIAARELRLQEGEAFFNQAIAYKADYAQAYFNLARVYMQQNQPRKADRALREAVRLQPAYASQVMLREFSAQE